jgi:hypothetical protein
MSILILGKEREAHIFTSESYKTSVRKYLESQGYFQTTDAFVEGSLEDMVFFNQNIQPGKEFWVEAKAQNVSLTDKNFSIELIRYYLKWIKLEKERRFKLLIFLQNIQKPQRWKFFFENRDEKLIDEWLKTILDDVNKEEAEEFNSTKKENFLIFLSDLQIIVSDARTLDNASKEKTKTSALSPKRKAKSLLDESERRNRIIQEKCELISNLVKFEYPPILFLYKTKFKNIEDIWKISSDSTLPPYILEGNYLYSFCNQEQFHMLNDYFIGKPTEIYSKDLLLTNPSQLIKIINFHLEKIARCKDLKKYSDNIYFFSKKVENIDEFEDYRTHSYTGKNIQVIKAMYDKNEGSRINFLIHRAVLMKSSLIWEKPYITILPIRHFTTDGRKAIEGENKSRLDSKFRKSAYNRSLDYLRFSLFWKYYLFEKDFKNEIFAKWFEKFKFKGFERFELMGIPESIAKDQRFLEDWINPGGHSDGT